MRDGGADESSAPSPIPHPASPIPVILFPMLPTLLLLLQAAGDPGPVYHGPARPLDVHAPRLDTTGTLHARFDATIDLNPDFVFQSRGRVTAWGFEVEIRIPFKSLRYQSADPQDWGLQVERITQHNGYEDTWTPAVRASASFLIQSGKLVGLSDLHRGLVMEATPEFTTRVEGRPATPQYLYTGRPELGVNLRWGLTQNLNLSGTANPDFSQVEADVGQVTVNQRFALFYPEKRPFFLEGLEQFDTPNRLIYTRRITQPVAGAKLTGKAGGMNLAYLAAVDQE